MTNVKHPAPSDRVKTLRKSGKRSPGYKTLDTEARSLEEACHVIAAQQRRERQLVAQKSKPRTLLQQFSDAKLGAMVKKRYGLISLAPVGGITHNRRTFHLPKPSVPHPLRDLPKDQKRERAREMYASGQWGWRDHGYRALARAFGETFLTMVIWLRDIEPPM
jgi:hypothetical protein